MRRLPVYLVIDTSGSMIGDPLESVELGIKALISTLRKDPHALETVFISVITYDNTARQVTPLTELAEFRTPKLNANGVTSFGAALAFTAYKIDTEVIKTSADSKGDWRPMVFIMTDGKPTDGWEKELDGYNNTPIGLTVACAVGEKADSRSLQKVTDLVVRLDKADEESIMAYFKWVSASIATGSQKINSGGNFNLDKFGDLPEPPPEIRLEN